MGLEGMTKGVRAGVARRAGHFADAVARIEEQCVRCGRFQPPRGLMAKASTPTQSRVRPDGSGIVEITSWLAPVERLSSGLEE